MAKRKRTVNFTAFPTEIAVWEAKAKADGDRTLSQWIRMRLLLLDGMDKGPPRRDKVDAPAVQETV